MNSKSSQKTGFDLNALDVLLDSFARSASDPSTERNQFYSSVNQKVVACTESQAAAVFLKNREGQVRVVNQSGWDKLDTATSNELKGVVQRAYSLDLSVENARAPSVQVESLAHSSAFVAHCLPVAGRHFVFVLVRNKQSNELAEQVFGDLADEIASQIEAFESVRAANQKTKSVLDLTLIAQLVQNLGKSGSLSEMSFNLVNDLAKITKADRVTFVGNAGKILAVSGVARVSFRTSVARVLTKIARLVASSGGSCEWTDGEVNVDGPRQPRGISQLVRELPSMSGFAIPVQVQNRGCGVLLVEYFSGESSEALERRELVNEAIGFAAPVIGRSVEVYSIPAIGGMDLLFNRFLVKPVRAACTLGLLTGLTAVCLYFLFGIQRPFEIFGEGMLQTAEERHVFSQIDGEVEDILVREGTFVQEHEKLLVIQSEELEKELITIEGEIEEAKQEMRNLTLSDFRPADEEANPADETKTASEIERLKIRLATLNSRLAFFENRQSQLDIHSPIAGQVTTPNLRQRLTDRPINRGDLLLTVSDTNGQWEVELEVPDNRVEFISAAQSESSPEQPLEVVFRLASDSEKTFVGYLDRLDYRSEQRAESEPAMVWAYVRIDETELGDSLRLGTRVYGKIKCGSRNNFFLLTYEARHKIREWLFH